MQNTITNKQLLYLLQLCDSSFPIGGFNHSYGLETYIRKNIVVDKTSLLKWLKVYLNKNLTFNDCLAIKLVYESLNSNDFQMLYDLDNQLTIQTCSKKTRDGIKLVGKQATKTYLQIHDLPFLRKYQNKIMNNECFGHPSIAYAILCFELEIDLENAIFGYLYSVISTLVQNAVRAIPLGQKDGLLIINELFNYFPEIFNSLQKYDITHLGMAVPGMDIAQMQHEDLEFKLFMS